MLNTISQKTHAKDRIPKKCRHDLSSNQYSEKDMKCKRNKEKSESVSVRKQFKTHGMFFEPSSYYKGDNFQLSVVNNCAIITLVILANYESIM